VTAPTKNEFFVWTLFQQLRRRGLPLGPDEFEAFRHALRAGFGWSSRKELRDVCAALWAKSPEEVALVAALFDQHVVVDWTLDPVPAAPQPEQDMGGKDESPDSRMDGINELESADITPAVAEETALTPALAPTGRLPPLTLSEMPSLPYRHVFLPQYPVNLRTAVQTWRRLRWAVREGPATELDVEATVQRRSRVGTVTPPILRPRRLNRARLLLLVDRLGSMAPFHGYVDEVCEAIRQSGRLREVATFYFHDTPLEGADPAILRNLTGGPFSSLDSILGDIPPLTAGELCSDRALSDPKPAPEVLAEHAQDAAVVIVSDAGAARGKYDLLRLLDTVAFLKGLKGLTGRIVWLNPLAPEAWVPSSAAEIARHVPMFAMDQEGMHRSVNVLRGQPYTVEKPISASAEPSRVAVAEAKAAIS
jgi:uncharacterized protein with von Willebrand factor type A (vWA) domain